MNIERFDELIMNIKKSLLESSGEIYIINKCSKVIVLEIVLSKYYIEKITYQCMN
jgi:hypothetical protein